MSRGGRFWPVAVVLVITLSLEVAPLPGPMEYWRAPWVALAVIYWSMRQPGRYGVGTAWAIGLVLDVLKGTVLGEHSLMLAIVAFLTIKFCQRLRVFPIWQQTAAIGAIAAVYVLIGVWIDGMTGDVEGGLLRLLPIFSAILVWPPLRWVSNRLITPLVKA
jgi:rod shape-determining protein MreD